MTSEQGKTLPKRTTLTIDPDVKLVFEYSQRQSPSRNTSKHLQELLKAKFGQDNWDELYKKATEYFRRCPIHDKPYVRMCKTCETAFCEDCDLSEHEGHDIQFYCTKHQFTYKRHCDLCEIDSWKQKVDVKGITADELATEINVNPDLMILDVRSTVDQQIMKAHNVPYYHFREETEENKQLLKLIEENPDAKWVAYSQGRRGLPGSMRGWLATLDLNVKYKVKNAFYLDGGFINFLEKYPKLCSQTKK